MIQTISFSSNPGDNSNNRVKKKNVWFILNFFNNKLILSNFIIDKKLLLFLYNAVKKKLYCQAIIMID